MNNTDLANKARVFQELHHAKETFIMANAWSAGSAILLEEAGIKAIGTTSAGIAFNHGLPDYEGALSFHQALIETTRISNSVNTPVSMDAENGYGHSSETVSKNMQKIVETGVVGASIEDYTGDMKHPLYELEMAVDRIKAAKEVTANLTYPFVLTARTECYLVGHKDAFKESVRRLNLYKEAGADCLFVPGLKDKETIEAIIKEVDGPMSVVMGLAGVPISMADLKKIGVTRISIGGSLARATYGLIRQAAHEMLEFGTFEFSKQQIPDNELCQLFSYRKK